jgi:hypothetical protein
MKDNASLTMQKVKEDSNAKTYKATPALLILGALAGAMQLLDAGIGLFEHDLGKCAGPLFIAVLQFFVVYLLHRSLRITPQTKRG